MNHSLGAKPLGGQKFQGKIRISKRFWAISIFHMSESVCKVQKVERDGK